MSGYITSCTGSIFNQDSFSCMIMQGTENQPSEIPLTCLFGVPAPCFRSHASQVSEGGVLRFIPESMPVYLIGSDWNCII